MQKLAIPRYPDCLGRLKHAHDIGIAYLFRFHVRKTIRIHPLNVVARDIDDHARNLAIRTHLGNLNRLLNAQRCGLDVRHRTLLNAFGRRRSHAYNVQAFGFELPNHCTGLACANIQSGKNISNLNGHGSMNSLALMHSMALG